MSLMPILLILILSGCTQALDFAMHPIEYQPRNQIDLKVELRLSGELRNAQSEISTGGVVTTVNLGGALGQASEMLARRLFSDVLVTSNDSEAPSHEDVDAILIPRMASVARTRPVFVFQTQKSTIILGWTMKDTKGNIIWIDTFTAEGEGPFATWAWTLGPSGQIGGAQIQFEDAFTKVFQESFKRMASSEIIEEFAASKNLKSRK